MLMARSRRSPLRHTVHTRDPRYNVSQYNRGIPIQVTGIPKGVKVNEENRSHSWDSGPAHGFITVKGIGYWIRGTAFSRSESLRFARELREKEGVHVAIKGKFSHLFNRVEYLIGSKAPTFNEIKAEAKRKNAKMIRYGEHDYYLRNGEWIEEKGISGNTTYSVR